MTETTAANPELLQEQAASLLVQPLEAASVVLSSGPRIFDTASPLRIPKLTSGVSVGFIEEGVELDAYNDVVAVFTPARDQPGTTYTVYGTALVSSTETVPDRLLVDKRQLLVPPNFPAAVDDLVDIPGDGQYQVIGDPEDYWQGPFGFRPGLVLNLRKVIGSEPGS